MEMNKEKIKLKDGRYLIYYTFETEEEGIKKQGDSQERRENRCQN